ncbi:cyclic nucleotide-binding domain-containing protein [Myxococcota bacterium]|nr:cyclic nucleotide-binding domain-containing protein [Myxococcota bacterium]
MSALPPALADLPGLRALLDGPELRGLSPQAVAAVAAIAEPRTFPPGARILSDQEPSDALYLLAEGLVQATWRGEDRRAPLRVVLGPGDAVGQDALGGTGSVGAQALSRVTAVRIAPGPLRALFDDHPDLERLVARMTAVQGRQGWVLRQLRKTPLFRHVAPGDLALLLPGARLLRGQPGEVLSRGQDELPGLWLVTRGEVLLRACGPIQLDGGTRELPELAMGEGAVIGDSALAHGSSLWMDVVAGAEGCALLLLPRENFDHAFARSLSFRRAVLRSPILADGERSRLQLQQVRKVHEGLRIFQAVVADAPGVDVSRLTRWLAEAAALDWGDRVVVVRVDPAHRGEAAVQHRDVGPGWVRQVRVPARWQGPSVDLIEHLLQGDMALLDLGALPEDHRDGPWSANIQRLVVVGTRAYQLDGAQVALQVGADLPLYTAVVPSAAPQPGTVRHVPYGTARIHRDLLQACRQGAERADLPAGLREQVHRWMRAVTGRRLGVALGGGGALSFAEAAVLQRLHEARIPVDMVAGVSGGALVGAYYAAGMERPLPPGMVAPEGLEGLPGLARLTLGGAELERAILVAPITGWALAGVLERHLGHGRLEDLLLPFFPSCVDGDRAVQDHIRLGPVAWGARASGSFPGTFTPTTLDLRELRHRLPLPGRARTDLPGVEEEEPRHRHLLDGGLLNNIPDDTLFLEGAQVVLACNVVPTPAPREISGLQAALRIQQAERVPAGRGARFLRELSPVVRIDDLLRAVYMLLYQPADWHSRTADVKFQGQTVGYSFAAFRQGDEIRRQALDPVRGPAVDHAVEQVRRAREALRWKRDGHGDQGELARLVAARLKA